MRAVVQRVLRSSVSIGGELTASIEKGLMVLIGVEVGDTAAAPATSAPSAPRRPSLSSRS